MTNRKMVQTNATVVKNVSIGKDYRKIILKCPAAFSGAAAGQFVTLSIPGIDTPLLRRPFSIHTLSDMQETHCNVSILFKVIGKFTETLSRIGIHDQINILGPLGRGFAVTEKSGPVAIIGGGIGVAPLVFLAESLRRAGPGHENSRVFLGGQTAADILCVDDFTQLGYTVSISTQDGTLGKQAIVTGPFNEHIVKYRPETIYACGPMPMLKAVHDIAAARGIACQVSVETVMACGIGICLGCAIRTLDDQPGYRHVCKDGPVFNAADLWQG